MHLHFSYHGIFDKIADYEKNENLHLRNIKNRNHQFTNLRICITLNSWIRELENSWFRFFWCHIQTKQWLMHRSWHGFTIYQNFRIVWKNQTGMINQKKISELVKPSLLIIWFHKYFDTYNEYENVSYIHNNPTQFHEKIEDS